MTHIKAERLVDKIDVVVDCLGDPDHRHLGLASRELLVNGVRPAHRAVSADDVNLVDASGHAGVADISHFRSAAGGAEEGAPLLVDRIHHVNSREGS